MAGKVSVHPLETYLAECRAIRTTGANVAETSYYPALAALLNEVGRHLKPKVRCFMGLKDQGAGMPDGGLFTESQFAKRADAEPLPGQMPERGVIEVKPVGTDMKKLTAGEQVARYWTKYRLVLVTDLREFVLLGEDAGKTVVRERYALASTPREFWELAQHPRKAADNQGERFVEFLQRVMLHAAPLADPKDVAWFLASYARDARARTEAGALPTLDALRSALEQALGLKFEGEKGEHFFRSTLVQTLFYGVFAAWVLWHRAGGKGQFDWHNAQWSLHVPMIRALFEQLAVPSKLQPLGLVEPLELTAATLNRVARTEFFKRFEDRHAVQYFYEPFLQAFDPELRKQLGVWYTPEEIVRYMVRRVDQVLVSELGIADGLADPQVYILDPCCGTGAYLVETLAVIGERLKAKGGDALAAQRLKKAMIERVFGFEILPAPFVISHLQIGLLLSDLGAPLGEKERAGVYLTNALTGWEPPKGPKQHLVFPELEAERDAAEVVKRDKPILVILGNPPYNAFAGVAQGEESDLVEPYKQGLIKEWGIKKFNLDDLYVRFFRLAERRIGERSSRGIVSFISNHSWVSEPSFVVLRKNLLDSFDKFWIENMHGNRKISEYAPDGRTSETIFAVPGASVGIQQGVVISLWVKTGKSGEKKSVLFRDNLTDARAIERRMRLLSSLEDPGFSSHYTVAGPSSKNRFSFAPSTIDASYLAWPTLVELAKLQPFAGMGEDRKKSLISIDREQLVRRMRIYCDSSADWDQVRDVVPDLCNDLPGFPARKTRDAVLRRESFDEARILRFSMRPFDIQWCYYSTISPLWRRARPDYWNSYEPGTSCLVTRFKGSNADAGSPVAFSRVLCDYHMVPPNASVIPLALRRSDRVKVSNSSQEDFFVRSNPETVSSNLSARSEGYLRHFGIRDLSNSQELIWYHALSICYSSLYLNANADGIRQDWPRIPLPATKELLAASAELGRTIAALLDTETSVAGVTSVNIRDELKNIAVISRAGGGTLDPGKGDLALVAGWGHAGKGGVTMPGKGKLETRAAPEHPAALGAKTHDVYLNGIAYWKNVPEKVWDYTIGGYQVMKKWLSYREHTLLGRDLTMEEAEYVTEMARRIAAILLMSDALDANYLACKENTWAWPGS